MVSYVIKEHEVNLEVAALLLLFRYQTVDDRFFDLEEKYLPFEVGVEQALVVFIPVFCHLLRGVH